MLFNFRSSPGFLSAAGNDGDGPITDISTYATGADKSPSAPRQFLLEIYAGILRERLKVRWRYSPEVLAAARISNLSNIYAEVLRNEDWTGRP